MFLYDAGLQIDFATLLSQDIDRAISQKLQVTRAPTIVAIGAIGAPKQIRAVDPHYFNFALQFCGIEVDISTSDRHNFAGKVREPKTNTTTTTPLIEA